MTRAEIVPVDPLHIREICATMREQEAGVVSGRDPEAMIRHELATSFRSWAGVVDGEVIALGGIKLSDVLSDEAYVWLFCSERVSQMPIAFVRIIREAFAIARARYGTIYGVVCADFTKSVRWLEWLGFTVEPPVNNFCLFWFGKRPVI